MLNNYEEASRNFQLASRDKNYFNISRELLIKTDFKKGDTSGALKRLNDIAEDDKNSLLTKAHILKEFDQNKEAIEILLKLSKKDPSDMCILEEIGVLHIKENNPAKAKHFFEICLKNNHKTDQIYYFLSKEYFDAENFEKACQYFVPIKNKVNFYQETIKLIQYFIINGKQRKALALIEDIYENLDLLDRRDSDMLFNCVEIMLGKTELKSYPKYLQLEPTGICNFRCIICSKTNYTISKHQKDELKEMFSYATSVLYTGGEPFLYPHIMELLQAGYEYGVRQNLVTNGSLLTEEIVEKLAAMDIKLAVSVDGTDKTTYEKIRIGANFETLLKNLEIIKKHKKQSPWFYTHTNFTVSEENYKCMEDMVDFAAKYNFNEVSFLPYRDSTDPFSKKVLEYIEQRKNILYKKAQDNNIALNCLFINYTPPNAGIASPSTNKTTLPPDKQHLQNLKADIAMLMANKDNLQERKVKCLFPWNALALMGSDKGAQSVPHCTCHNDRNRNESDYWNENRTFKEMWNARLFTTYRKDMLASKQSILCNPICNADFEILKPKH